MIRHRGPRRGGFTLIELLVVIAILAILSALVTAGIGRIRSAQQTRNTEATLTKLQQALDGQRKAIIDQCKQDRLNKTIPGLLVGTPTSFCGSDWDMAEAVWVYLNLKRDLPETFLEANGEFCPNPAQRAGSSPFSSPDNRRGYWLWSPPVASNPAILVPLAPRTTFAKFSPYSLGGQTPQFSPTPTQPPLDESAVLLYTILTEKGNKGTSFAADDATTGAQTELPFNSSVATVAPNKFRVFTDTWGQPIWFNRLANFAELQGQPFVPASQLIPFAGASPSNNLDPIDQARVPNPAGGTPFAGKLLYTMTPVQRISIHVLAAPSSYAPAPAVPVSSVTPPPPPPYGIIDGLNKVTSVYSAGPDKAPQVWTGNTATDDVLGYRLRRLGASGG